MKTIIFTILLCVLFSQAYSQDTSSAKYFPLQTGNVWVYYGTTYAVQYGTWFNKCRVTGTIDTLGKRYYNIQSTIVYVSGYPYSGFATLPQRLRIDSLTANIIQTFGHCGNVETVKDSLRSRLHDTLHICSTDTFSNKILCMDTNSFSIFGSNWPSKQFFTGGFETSETRRYSKYIGLISLNTGFMGGSSVVNLVGCYINGQLRGDTNMIVGIQNISSEIPASFSLSQNYPNPFNPATNIKYQITKNSFVKIAVYNVLGEEVSLLVNENQKAGTYEVNWNAENSTSGVYFYKLITEDFTATKKMVLLK